jgi:HPt (histidine-containing phosphotransfer) domain-containing protein
MTADKEDEEFMSELKREFKIRVGSDMVELKSLYKEEKFEDIARIAHDIKGTAGLFALGKGGEIAMKLQQSAQNRESENTRALIDELISYMKEAGMIEA